MKKSMILLFPLFTALIILGLTGCPQPLSEEDVVAAQDGMAPIIEIYSPSDRDIYYSTVDFSLKVRDDAEGEEDGKGDLASFAFDVSNDDLRGGKVFISADGTLTQDGPDDISYDSKTGEISFSFSTIEPGIISGAISVTLTAVDRNGNVTEESLLLSDSDGPWVDYTIKDTESGLEKSYTEDTTVRLYGSVGNSSENRDAADQITGISWSVQGKAWSGTLEIDKSATYVDSDSSLTLSYYNSSQKRYERENDGFTYPELFIYDPSTREFSTEIDIPFGIGSVLPFEVTVTDKNEHSTSLIVNAYSNESGPEVVIETPTNASLGYFSAGVDTSDVIEGYINGGIADLQSFKYEITDLSDDYSSGKIDVTATAFGSSPYNSASNEFFIEPDISKLVSTDGSSTPYPAGSGNIKVTIYAVNDNGIETRPSLVLYEDSDGPVISGLTFVSDYSDPSYANDDSGLTLSFTASDSVTDGASLVMTEAEIADDSSAGVSQSGGTFTVTPSSWTGASYSDAELPYTVSVKDELGNVTTVTQATAGAPQITYYSGDPDATHLDSITMAGENAPTAYAVSGEDILISVDSKRNISSIDHISASGFSSSVAYDGADSSKAVITLSRSDTGVETYADFSFDIIDAAGNTTSSAEGNSIDQNDVPTVVFYDSDVPDAPVIAGLLDAQDTSLAGLSDGTTDNITSNTTNLTIEGTAEPGSDVSLYRNGIFAFTVAVNPSSDPDPGDWSGTMSGTLPEGSYSLVAKTVDPAGNSSADSSSLALELLTSAPSNPISIDLDASSDSSRTGLSGGTSDGITNITSNLLISGKTAADGYIILYEDGSPLSNFIQADASGDWNTTINLADEGDNTLLVRSADKAGNESSGSQSMIVKIDTTDPAAPSISLDAADDSGLSDSDRITNIYTDLTFSGTTSETNELEIFLRGVRDDGSTPIAVLADQTVGESGGAWTGDFTLDSVDDEGVNTIYAKAVDRAGNQSSEVSLGLTLDVTPPSSTSLSSLDLLSAYDSGLSSTDDITNETGQMEFSYSVDSYDTGDLDFAGDSLFVELTSDKEAVSTYLDRMAISSSGTKNVTANKGLAEESHTVTAALYDAAGNKSSAETSLPVETDFTAPDTNIVNLTLDSASDSGLYDDDGITNESGVLTFHFDVTGYEEDSYVELSSSADDNLGQLSVSSGGTGKTLATSGGLSENDNHTISLQLKDIAGNVSSGSSGSYSLKTDYSAPAASVSSVALNSAHDSGISSSDGITNRNNGLDFDIVISDEPEESYLILASSEDSTLITSEIASLSAVYSTPSALSEDTHDITATLYDIAGNLADTNTDLQVITDYTAPTASVDSIDLQDSSDTGYDNSDNLTKLDELSFDFAFTGVDESSYIKLTSSVDGDVGSVSFANGTVTADITTDSGLSEGTHNFSVAFFDEAGNSSSGTVPSALEVVLDHTAPVTDLSGLSLTDASDLGIDQSDELTSETGVLSFDLTLTTASFEDDSYIELSSDKESPALLSTTQIAAAVSSTILSTDAGLVQEDVHEITAVLYDEAGNQSAGSTGDASIETDYTAPQFISVSKENIAPGRLEFIFSSDLQSGIFGASDELTAMGFSAPSSPADYLTNYTFTGTFGLDQATFYLSAYDVTPDQVDFPDAADLVLDFAADFTDAAGNIALQDNGVTALDKITFDVSGVDVENEAQSGISALESFSPLFVEEDVIQPSRSRAFGYDRPSRSDSGTNTQRAVSRKESAVEPVPHIPDARSERAEETIAAEDASVPSTAVLPAEAIEPELSDPEEYNRINREALIFMEQVETNRLAFESQIEQIRMHPVPRDRLMQMDAVMNPVIPEVETITLYSSPIPTAFEAPVILEAEDTILVQEDETSLTYLLIQAAIALAIGVLTFLFLWFMNRSQRKDHGILD